MKSILVPLDPSEFSAAATEQACLIAKHFGSRVVGMTIVDLEGIDEEIRLPFRMDLMEYPRHREVELVKASKEELQHVATRFQNTCDENGISCETKETRGVPAVKIVDESRFHDLVVMGLRSHFRFITETDDDDILQNVINHSCVPMLLVPGREPTKIEKVAIAFDGSPPATRALHRFAKLASCWQPEIKIVTAMKAKKGAPVISSAQNYLEAHGYTNVQADLIDEPIIEAFQDTYIDWADLCVLGSSSKSVVEKMILGSFPKKLILDGHLPLLINP